MLATNLYIDTCLIMYTDVDFTGCYQIECWVDDVTQVHGMLCQCSKVDGTC